MFIKTCNYPTSECLSLSAQLTLVSLCFVGIKEFTSWPTIPQVFFDGEFVGGCDILLEMHKSGEIVEQLKNIGINSPYAEDEDKN